MAIDSSDTFNLQRFVDAQASTFAQARTELAAGQKQTHWIWFIFPQIAGLGSSSMARRYAIQSLGEARAYLAHPLLGARLLDCTDLVVAASPRLLDDILGYPDDLKFHSSVTLFNQACDSTQPVFQRALKLFFAGRLDRGTLERLR